MVGTKGILLYRVVVTMILHNGRILTMDDALPHASALAIAGGKVIGGVDSREDAIASHAHERIDLQGATVIPGLVDAHVHFRGWAMTRIRVQLHNSETLDEVLSALSKHANERSADEWILGFGWRNDIPYSGNGTSPADLLEKATAGRPAALASKDGHALWLNERALSEIGISLDQLEDDGVVERTADGRFAGILRETAAWTVRNHAPESDLNVAAMASAMRAANARGVTAVHDMDGSAGLRTWRELDRERGLTLRVRQNLLVNDLPHAAALGVDYDLGSDRLRIGGIKIFIDGTLGSGTAWLHESEEVGTHDLAGAAPRKAVIITPPDELDRIVREASAAGFPILAHAIGDAACTSLVNALETTHMLWNSLSAPPRIEHAQLMRDADIKQAAHLGIAFSVQPSHLLNDRDLADQVWGLRTQDSYAFRSILGHGGLMALGSDAPIEDLNPLTAISAAVKRTSGNRKQWHPEQCIDAETALWCSTVAPSAASGTLAEIGALTPGKAADLVVLSGNPLEDDLDSIEIVATMVGGRWVFGRTKLAS